MDELSETRPSPLRCLCGHCGMGFRLTPDTEKTTGADRCTYIKIRSCQSGGIYETSVICPYCGHDHDLCP